MKLSHLAKDLHGTLCLHPDGHEKKETCTLLEMTAEDFADSLVGFLAEDSADLVGLVGSLVAVVAESLLWVLSY